jgi:ribosomal protein S16
MLPMEPVSFTIGAVALAGLFSLCIQCFDLIEIGRKTSVYYKILVVKLSLEKRRLMVWSEAVGILRPDQDRDLLLDDLETRILVERILSSVQRLFDETQNLKSKYGLEKASSTQNSPKAMIHRLGNNQDTSGFVS